MALVNFTLYSTDATGSPPNPDTASTKIVIPLPANQKTGEAQSIFEPPQGRGSVKETFDSIVIQDFGVPSNYKGGRIFLEDFNSLSESAKSSLETAYETTDTSWYFTDGISYYQVKFSRNPAGFHAWMNYAMYMASGRKLFSYAMELIIEEKL